MTSSLEQMKVLELDLLGYDLNIGIRPVFKTSTVNMLRDKGVTKLGSKNFPETGTVSGYLDKHIKSSRNFIIFSNYPMLETQETNSMKQTTSLLFDFYRPSNRNKMIYLELTSVNKEPKVYNGVKKISVDTLDNMVKNEKIAYKPRSDHFYTLTEIENFGVKRHDQKSTAAPITEVNLSQREVTYRGLETVNRAINFKPADHIAPPEFDVEKITFKASDIPKLFILPDYQRKKYSDYGAGIFKAIGMNEFFSVDLMSYRATDPRDGAKKDVIINGQQRLSELWNVSRLIDPNLIYKFALIRFPEEVARKVYQKVNRGKQLVGIEQMRGMDDGTIPIFRVLESLGIAGYSNKALTVPNIIKMYDYGQNKIMETGMDRLLEIPPTISIEKSQVIGNFLKVDKKVNGNFNKDKVPHKQIILNNLFRIYLEKGMDDTSLEKLIRSVNDDVDMRLSSKNRGAVDYKNVYSEMKELYNGIMQDN